MRMMVPMRRCREGEERRGEEERAIVKTSFNDDAAPIGPIVA